MAGACRAGGPAFGARSHVTAVPANVAARVAAVGDHLSRGQVYTTHPARLHSSLPCGCWQQLPLTSHSRHLRTTSRSPPGKSRNGREPARRRGWLNNRPAKSDMSRTCRFRFRLNAHPCRHLGCPPTPRQVRACHRRRRELRPGLIPRARRDRPPLPRPRVVLARSYARIHWQNLVSFGVLPLEFTDPADYQRIQPDHRLAASRCCWGPSSRRDLPRHHSRAGLPAAPSKRVRTGI